MIVIRTQGRCGSNMLASALGSHPDINNHGELLQHSRYGYQLTRFGALAWLSQHNVRQNDCLIAHGLVPKVPAVKAAYEEFWLALRVFKPRIILLEREDFLRQYASRQIAREREIWHRTNPQTPQPDISVELDQSELITQYMQSQQIFQTAREEFPWGYRVTYEALVSDWETNMRRILQYLDLTVTHCRPETLKQDERPIREIVRNYGKLKAALAHKPNWKPVFDAAERGEGRKAV